MQIFDLKREKMLQAIKDAGKDANERIFRFAALASLVVGATAPIFQSDVVAKYIAAICIVALAALASITLFRRRSP